MKRLIAAIFCLSVSSAFADDVADLEGLLKPLQTLEGGFQQKVKDRNGEVIQATEGRFAIRRPGFFFWESQDPHAQVIVGTPAELWVYDPDLEQATVRQKGAYADYNPSDLLSGDVSGLGEKFEVSQQKNKSDTHFTLKPKSNSAQYQQVHLHFKGKRPVAFAFSDQLNQSTEVTFSSLKLNRDLDEALFQFSPPPGTDVLVDE